MRAEDLKHDVLLGLDSSSGVLRFAGQRAILIDVVALGLLRKYLVENFGLLATRTVLTQFGFAHGWRTADAMKSEFAWNSEDDWSAAGTHLHVLEGLFRVELGSKGPLSKSGLTFGSSYEAEQHLLHLGPADSPCCWTICGLISGYLSRTTGREIYVLEDRCVASGHAACHLYGRTREEWGASKADELGYFDPKRLAECLDISLKRVIQTLKAAETELREHERKLAQLIPEYKDTHGLVARSREMQGLLDLARRVGKVDVTVLIAGESGVGKERVARFLHDESSRASGPFVAINCGAIPETLLESELFGHVRGSFTGAAHDRTGLFEAAHSGTLLLDEIGDISPTMQVKLLRVLQEREVRRVGENRNRAVDVRIIAATNRDLSASVASGDFRQDLYYRLRVVELRVPALRDRQADIVALAHILLEAAAKRMGRSLSTFSQKCADRLVAYAWPGNVRELENAMERAAALATGSRVELDDLPEEIRKLGQFVPLDLGAVRPLDAVLRDYIVAVLERSEGNQTRAASALGIGTATLHRKLKSYGMTSSAARPPVAHDDLADLADLE